MPGGTFPLVYAFAVFLHIMLSAPTFEESVTITPTIPEELGGGSWQEISERLAHFDQARFRALSGLLTSKYANDPCYVFIVQLCAQHTGNDRHKAILKYVFEGDETEETPGIKLGDASDLWLIYELEWMISARKTRHNGAGTPATLYELVALNAICGDEQDAVLLPIETIDRAASYCGAVHQFMQSQIPNANAALTDAMHGDSIPQPHSISAMIGANFGHSNRHTISFPALQSELDITWTSFYRPFLQGAFRKQRPSPSQCKTNANVSVCEYGAAATAALPSVHIAEGNLWFNDPIE